jgi:hypothetical protein
MDHHSRRLVIFTALLAGIVGLAGVARAELVEPAVIQPPIKSYHPLPAPRAGSQAIVIHRSSPARAAVVAAMVPSRPKPHCGWFDCNQFVIVGIGF